MKRIEKTDPKTAQSVLFKPHRLQLLYVNYSSFLDFSLIRTLGFFERCFLSREHHPQI